MSGAGIGPRPGSRERVLARVRAALADVPREETPDAGTIPRGYREAHRSEGLHDLLAENLADYRAIVHRTPADGLPALLGELLGTSRSVALPDGLPGGWLTALPEGLELLTDTPELTLDQLARVDCVLTGCTVAIAETGTIVLDGGPAQGRRRITLVPDHHVCVVRPDQVVASVGQALPRLDPARPQTWISGPSATSDIELDRVEGVHGPRRLDVVLLED